MKTHGTDVLEPAKPLLALPEPIQTHFVYPPIPIRTHDWVAYRDPEAGGYGYGRTEAEAIADLLSEEDPPFYVLVLVGEQRVMPRIVHPDDYNDVSEAVARNGGVELVIRVADMYIGLLDHHPVYSAKMGALNARTARRRHPLSRLDWQIRVNRMIARNAHDKRTVKPSTTRYKRAK